MARIKPFRALRPTPSLAAKICELPYDVMSSDEALEIAGGNPLSFLHVSKPEIDLPRDVNPYSDAVYEQGRENFQRFIEQGALVQDASPRFYLYQQVMGGHKQLGLVAVADCEEYLSGIIKKHEFTRPDKEDDRVRHIETLNSQTGPVFLTYRATAEVDALFANITTASPEIDFQSADGVRHTSWVIADASATERIRAAFETMNALYIADGHHRSAAAARVFRSRNGAGESKHFLVVLFPHNQMQILPYNRVLKDLNGNSLEAVIEKLDAVFVIRRPGSPRPAKRHEVSFYSGKEWISLSFRPKFVSSSDPVEKLDVALLQNFVLAPMFGIDDPRTSKRISFVGGIRGTAELEKLVNAGEYACAFSMFPTSIEELMAIADAGGIMPPKSTWFEPKLRDAMFCHML